MVDIHEASGIEVHLLEADEGLPCNVYARHSSAMTPWGALIASIQTPYRRRDYAVVSQFYYEHDDPIWRWATTGHFEGGDFDIIEPGAVVRGYNNERSDEAGARQVAGWVEKERWEALVVPIPAHFVHMDALVVAIASKLVVACTDALEDYVVDWLKGRGIEIVNVPYRACIGLGCNVVSFGDSRVLSMASNADLNDRLRAMGFEVFAPDMSQFQHGGGGVHCMSQALRRDPATA